MYKPVKAYIKKNIKLQHWEKIRKIRQKKSEFSKYVERVNQKLRLYFKYLGIKPENYLSVVAIIKDEGAYIVEWIEYHLIVGVSKFLYIRQ